ncbi:MAG: hypothetical protein IAE90_00485 [Ignavibacteria bacterium]|nr:hypothetical protein [Ignavibacteria bacterium]
MKYEFYKTILGLVVFLVLSGRIYTQDVKTLSGHSGNINCIAFSPDAKKLLSGSSDGTVRVWSAETGDLINTVTFGENVTSVNHSGTSSVYGVTTIGGAFITDMETGSVSARLENKPNTYNISFSPDGKFLAVNSFYKTDHYYYKDGQKYEFQKYHFLVDIYDGSSYRLIKTLKVLEEDRKALLKLFGDNVMESYRTNYFMSTFTRDSKFLATGLPNGQINIYSFITNDFRRNFTGHDKNVYGLEFSADGNYLISASMDEEVKVWNITTGKSIKTLNGHDNDVNDAVFSPDSKFAASASDDETVKVWDVSKGKHIKTLKGHQGDVITVIFSPDGRYIASGGKDEKIKLWSTESFLPELKLFTAEFDAKIGINAAIQEEKATEINAVNIEYFMPKGEFETTEEYNGRLEIGRMKKQEIEDKYREKLEAQQFVKQQEVEELKTKEQEEKERKIAESERDTVLKIDNLSKYDADNETFTVTVKNVTGKIKVPRSEAPGLKDGWKKAQVKCRKKLSDNMKYHNYSNLVVVHPVTKSEYAVDDGKKKEEESSDPDQTEMKSNDPYSPEEIKQYRKGESIELFDLMEILMPAENETPDEFDWSKGDLVPAINWQEKQCNQDFCYKLGVVKVLINGKKTEAEGDWNFSIDGSKTSNGFDSFSASFGYFSHGIGGGDVDCESSLNLEYAFPNRNLNSTLLAKKECMGGEAYADYEVKFPGKRTVWIRINYSSGSRQGMWIITCFFNKSEMEKDRW